MMNTNHPLEHCGESSTNDIDDDDQCCPICYESYLDTRDFSFEAMGPCKERDFELTTLSTEDDSHSFSRCSDDDDCIDSEDCCRIETEVIRIGANVDHSNRSLSSTSARASPPKCQTNHSRTRHCHPSERVTIPGCGHDFCRGCLREHVSYAISIRDIPLRCPDSGCSRVLPIDFVRECLFLETRGEPLDNHEDEESSDCSSQSNADAKRDWTKFQRFHRMAENPSLIPCTRCDELISPDDPSAIFDTQDPNRVCCPACQHVFCRVHGDGHPGKSCGDSGAFSKADQASKQLIDELCKPCSHCGVPISKHESDCNHVVCPVCQNDMCYRCGTHEHLESPEGNVSVRNCKHCHGSYIDHRKIWSQRLRVLAKLPLLLPIYVGYVVMTLTLAVATCGCFGCLGCGVRRTKSSNHKPESRSLVFAPLLATREVLGWIFRPFIDLFRECRVPCCFCHNAPDLGQGVVTDDDESYYDEDDESKHTEDDDIENQRVQASKPTTETM